MRLGRGVFRRVDRRHISKEHSEISLSSFAGLEVFRDYLQLIDFMKYLRQTDAERTWLGDLRYSSLVMLLVANVLVGGRKVSHVKYLEGDPLVHRFVEMAKLPSARSISRSLSKMTIPKCVDLDAMSRFVVQDGLRHCKLRRLTLDIDGTVITTGLKVEGASRGFNRKKSTHPSYYPITVMIAQTGHVLEHRNRTGGIHDSHDADSTLRKAIGHLREDMQYRGIVEIRADSAFYREYFLQACDELNVQYAIKIPMWDWLGFKPLIEKQTAWKNIAGSRVQGCFCKLDISQWGRTEKIAIIRTRRSGKPQKGIQLDLFHPDDGYWEYSVIATNKNLGLKALWNFMNGRGVQEKIIAELKTGFAFDSVVARNENANNAWQKISILAHNISTSLQLAAGAPRKKRSFKRTSAFLLRSISTVRFEWLNRVAHLVYPQGKCTMRMTENPMVKQHFDSFESAFAT